MKLILVEFIPIILSFLFLSYTEQFVNISHTILGRFIAISIILFYIDIDISYGLLACAIIILFYESDLVENMLNRYEYIEYFETKPFDEKSKNTNPAELTLSKESTMSYTTQYELHSDDSVSPDFIKNEFRRIHCDKGHLVNKGQHVRPEMTEHVFPEVKFSNEKCNVCDPTCNFSIIEKQLNTLLSDDFMPKSGRQ